MEWIRNSNVARDNSKNLGLNVQRRIEYMSSDEKVFWLGSVRRGEVINGRTKRW